MRVTKKLLKSFGYCTVGSIYKLHKTLGAPDESFSNDKYPFNHLMVHRRGTKFYMITNNTKYDCNDVHSFLATAYFCGIYDGESKKIAQIKSVLEIPENTDKR